jgi:hypothetical protein
LIFALLVAFALLSRFLPGRKSTGAAASSGEFVERIWPYFRSDSTKAAVAVLFGVSKIDVDYTGNVNAYTEETSPGRKIIGRVDHLGYIYDTRQEAAVKLGSLDDQGRVIGERVLAEE